MVSSQAMQKGHTSRTRPERENLFPEAHSLPGDPKNVQLNVSCVFCRCRAGLGTMKLFSNRCFVLMEALQVKQQWAEYLQRIFEF